MCEWAGAAAAPVSAAAIPPTPQRHRPARVTTRWRRPSYRASTGRPGSPHCCGSTM